MQPVTKTKTTLFIICIFIFSQSAYSQVLISSSGNTVDKRNLSVSWSLGEIAINTYKSGNIMLTQGFHQSSLIVSKIQEFDNSFILNVYPNPAREIINIKANEHEGMSYKIINALGSVIDIKNLTGNHTFIPTQKLNSGLYYLNLYKNETLIITYKISVIK